MADMRQPNVKYALSTGAIEHVAPSKEAVRLCEKLCKGKISADAAVASIKEKYGLAGRKSHG